MGNSYRLTLAGQPADDQLYTLIASLEVEEAMDTSAAMQIQLPLSRSESGDINYVADARFAPLSNIAVVATAGATGAPGVTDGAAALPFGGGAAASADQCIFDGYVLSQRAHLETGLTNSTVAIWAQDASWLMNQTEKAREWANVTDSAVAAAIFGEYGVTPDERNSEDDSASHTEDSHSLMQRGADLAFLRMLARRSGKVCRVACADRPGLRIGHFASPKLDGAPALTLTLNDPANWTVSELDFEWDATRPSAVTAGGALFSDPSAAGATGDAADSGLKPMGARDLASFVGQPTSVMLTAVVDNAGDLAQRARALLREAGWFARCHGVADADRLGLVLRPGMIAAVKGVGALFSGAWLVWSVRHRITREGHKMHFTLVRNALGAAA